MVEVIKDMNANEPESIDDPDTIQTYNEQSIYKRKLRSLTERILLIGGDLMYANIDNPVLNYIRGIDFTILGCSNTIYNVKIMRYYILDEGQDESGILYSCTCPDYYHRQNTCKHIYWIGAKFFNTMDPTYWNVNDYHRIITKYWINENEADHIGRNSDCPICLEPIDYQSESSICCTNQCYNAVHAICWGRYNDISGSTLCIFCRSNTMPNF